MRKNTGAPDPATDFEIRFINARRAAIELEFMHLNTPQREAVKTTEGPLLLLAGAGSGKTTVLINRIANLLKYGTGSDSEYVPDYATPDDLAFLEAYVEKQHDSGSAELPGASSSDADVVDDRSRAAALCAVDAVEPWRIIAITFTNKAAGEMKTRLEKMLGHASEDIWAMTFHSACARILRRDIDRLGYESSFTIYDTTDTSSLMKRIMKDLDIEERNFPYRATLGAISRAKDSMISAGDYLSAAQSSGDVRKTVIGRAFLEYETRMKASNSLDFDDLLLLAVRLFKEHPDVLQRYQKRFMHVLVDEYQDTNKLQYLFASALAGGYGNICVVGDDDQSIYKFRGATIENILSFEKHFNDARVIRLEQNYRSTGFILDAANDVIHNNKGRKGKKLWTENIPGAKPELHIIADEREEAQFVADKIISSASEGRKWQDHTVLYRMNAQSNQLETAFKRNGIPYRIFGGTGFYDRAEIKDMLAYLCLVHNPRDDVRLLRVINNPPRGIGDTSIGRLAELADEQNVPLFDAIRVSHNHDALKSAAARMHQFADMIEQLRELADSAPLDELYDELIRRTGYIKMLEDKGTDEAVARVENVRELKTNIINFMNENDGGSLFDFLSETALYTDLDRDDQSTDRVMMMTMHSAKGLEFDTVFIVGAEEGLFPGARSIGEPGEMEEERRLCYVAMTRAMRRLYFTSARRRMLFGKTSPARPSRFVREISDENIETQDHSGVFFGFDPEFDDEFDFGSGFGSDYSAPSQRDPAHPAANSRAGRSPQSYSQRYQPSRPAPRSAGSGVNTANSKPRSSSAFQTPGSTPNFNKGDSVEHSAFGRGVVTNMTPGGGDILLEIAFEASGTKRLLLNSAARYMKKL